MSNVLIAFMFAAGASAWVYSQFYKRTGGNNVTSLSATLMAGILVFMIFLTILWQVN